MRLFSTRMLSTCRSPQFSRGLLLEFVTLALFVLLAASGAIPQTPKRPPTDTEQLVRRFERLVSSGDLLTRVGWNRASELFEKHSAYQSDGVISVVSTGGAVGEVWVKGDRARVDTKWNDYFGTVDARLRFEPPTPDGSIGMIEQFSLVFIHTQASQSHPSQPDAPSVGHWSFEGALKARSATIEATIRYVKRRRDLSADPIVRKNADEAITALRRLANCRGGTRAC